jgi:hypothetical protein
MNAPDPASLERTVFVPFESTFCDPTLAPTTEEQQFKERLFPARRDLTGARCAALAHRLIYMFFVASANHGLNAPMATLPLTARMRLEARQHFKEVEHFRYYIQHCVRPVGCNGSSLTMRPYLTQAAQRTLRPHFVSQNARPSPSRSTVLNAGWFLVRPTGRRYTR